MGSLLPYILRYLQLDLEFMIFEQVGMSLDNWCTWTVSLGLSITIYDLVGLRDLILEMFLFYAIFLSLNGHMVAILKYARLSPTNMIIVKTYVQLRMTYNRIAPIINCLSFYPIAMTPFVFSLFMWFAISGFSFIPLVLSGSFIGGFISGMGLTLTIMNLLTNLRCMSVTLIQDSMKRLRTSNQGEQGYNRRLWKALAALPINCGEHFAFSKEAVMNYLMILTDADQIEFEASQNVLRR